MKTKNTQNELRICLVIYADILGYSDRILKCNNEYNALNRELKEFKSKIPEPQTSLADAIESIGGSVSFFSDSVYVHVPIGSRSPESFNDGRPYICIPIENISTYQFKLALQNIFIRGGATVNFGYMDDSVAFGPGMIHALECEKKARYPRICLTEWAMIPIKHYVEKRWPGHERINRFILYGEDGKYFINYLQTVVDSFDDSCEPIPDEPKKFTNAIESLIKHKENIELNIRESTKRGIRNKYIWLAKYHNFFCKTHFRDLKFLIIPKYKSKFHTISPSI